MFIVADLVPLITILNQQGLVRVLTQPDIARLIGESHRFKTVTSFPFLDRTVTFSLHSPKTNQSLQQQGAGKM